MSYIVQVDQSGKIEDTSSNTVIAFANGHSFAILIPAMVKRTCLARLRERGKTGKTIYRRLFTVALFLLLETYIEQIDLVIVDEEYTGQDASIKQELLFLIWNAGLKISANQIQFRQIHQSGGKNPPAHRKAYRVYRKLEKPGRVINARELLERIK